MDLGMSASGTKIRVLVVESDPELRLGLALCLGRHPFVDVIGTATSSINALPKIASFRPDWVIVDVCQNSQDGLDMLKDMHAARIATRRAVIASSTGNDTISMLAQARAAGVAAVVRRPAHLSGVGLVEQLGGDLLTPMLRASGARAVVSGQALRSATSMQASTPLRPSMASANKPISSGSTPRFRAQPMSRWLGCRVVGIGVSTGGPLALHELLPRIPANFSLPIVIVQHMPATFTNSLAKSLDKVCLLPVKEAEAGDSVVGGRVLIARGGRHMRVVRGATSPVIHVTDDPPECSCRPSVDYLFRSLAETFGKATLGVVLTGMGEDGWLGSRVIYDAGGRLLAQTEASSVVFGMPRGPIAAGIARPVSLLAMADTIVAQCGSLRCS